MRTQNASKAGLARDVEAFVEFVLDPDYVRPGAPFGSTRATCFNFWRASDPGALATPGCVRITVWFRLNRRVRAATNPVYPIIATRKAVSINRSLLLTPSELDE